MHQIAQENPSAAVCSSVVAHCVSNPDGMAAVLRRRSNAVLKPAFIIVLNTIYMIMTEAAANASTNCVEEVKADLGAAALPLYLSVGTALLLVVAAFGTFIFLQITSSRRQLEVEFMLFSVMDGILCALIPNSVLITLHEVALRSSEKRKLKHD